MTFFLVALVALGFAIYPILLYPLLVLAAASVRSRPWKTGRWTGRIAHIITVHNEEARMAGKLDNTLSLAVPDGGVETIVVDDGSTDGTEAIVRSYASRGAAWIAHPRLGKEAAQIAAVRATTAEILVFSDASARIDTAALPALLAPFADPEVAAVSGTDRPESKGTGTGEDLYVRYEMAVRRAEARAGSLVGLSGSFFAIRREIAERLLPDVPSDLGSALLCATIGKRAVCADAAVCAYTNTEEVQREFARKRRTALRGLRCLWAYRGALSLRRPVVTWQILSHKVARFLSPFFLALSFVLLILGALRGENLARVCLLAVAAAGGLGAASMLWPRLRRSSSMRAIGFLLLSNAAVLTAWGDLVVGRKQRTWAPTSRA